MREAVNATRQWSATSRGLLLIFVSLMFSLGPQAVAAEDGPAKQKQLGADRWVPSLSVISIATFQSWEGSTDSQICSGCTFPSSMAAPLRGSFSGSDLDATPFVGGSLEIMTPELDLPLSPRFFVGGEIAATFGFERSLALDGDPGELRSPNLAGNENQPYSESRVIGQGTATKAQLGSPFYGAYAGIAIPFTLFGRGLRVKPLVGWTFYKIDVTGQLATPQCQPINNCNPMAANPSGGGMGFQRTVELNASKTGSFNALGPGIELELDTGRLGPFGTGIFMGGRFYALLGDRTVEFSETTSFDDQIGMDQAQASWRFEADPWLYRVVAGFRMQWIGFSYE